jgi:hypothetical protein
MRNARRIRLTAFGGLIAPALLCCGLAAAHVDGTPQVRAAGGMPLLFVAQGYQVLAYAQRARYPSPLYGIEHGVVSPNGIATDASQNLYVTNANQTVAVYPRGKVNPIKTYYAGLTSPGCIAIGPDGSLYVCNAVASSGQPAGVIVYPPGHMQPTKTLSYSPFEYLEGVAVDAASNVYVSGYGSKSGVIEFPAGSLVAKDLGLAVNGPVGIAVAANGALVVSDFSSEYRSGEVKVFPPGSTKASLIFGRTGSAAQICFSSDGHELFVGDQGNNVVEAYRYPSGALVNIFSRGIATPNAVAADPPAPPGAPFMR